MKKTVILLSLLALAASASVPIVVDIETSETRTRYLDAFRGETVDLELQFRSYGEPMSFTNGTPAAVWWQTNGMGSAWWQAPAAVAPGGVARASWTPEMDCGADRYSLFVGVGGEDARSYRAAFSVRMHGAPGPHPNEIAPPVQILDFAKIAVTNAPWGEGGDLDGGAVTNIVEGIVAADDSIARYVDGGGFYAYGILGATNSARAAAWFQPERIMVWGEGEYGEYEGTTAIYFPANTWGTMAVREDLAPYARTDSLGTAAYKDANEFATSADEALVYQLLMGSNVVVEVTNYNSRVRAPQLRLLQLDQDTKEYFTVWAETNGLTRTLNDAKAYADGATNALDRAKADRAWSHSTSGLGADAPAGTTWISTPETVIAGGYEYERHVTTHGEVWVLTSNGMGFGGDSNSYFRVSTPDGETLFSIEKTDEQIVGVLTDGITISGGVVTLDVGVTTYNGQAPICMAAQSVSGPWSDLSKGRPAWISSVATNGVNGAWSFELESEASTAFFYFLVRQPGATVIKNSAQTDLSGGILVEGTRFYPHKSGSTLTWTTTP